MQITGGRYFQPGESIPDNRKEAVGADNLNSGAVSLLRMSSCLTSCVPRRVPAY